jgi:hypothetical protein
VHALSIYSTHGQSTARKNDPLLPKSPFPPPFSPLIPSFEHSLKYIFRCSEAQERTLQPFLQSFRTVLICRSDCHPQLSSVAQRQGVHRDGQRLGLTPFEIEMRGRLWWHIFILDMLCSDDPGNRVTHPARESCPGLDRRPPAANPSRARLSWNR